MKRVVLLTIAIILSVFATQRVMVMEDFTATWCTYCPGAARGAEELKFRAFDSVVVIAYHSSSSDPFYTPTAASRMSYYGVSGYPTMRMDGGYSVVGGMHYGTMYPVYRSYFESRKTQPSPFEIRLAVTYDSATRNGTLTIVVRNTSSASISAQLHTVLIEGHIYYPWQGMDSLQDVERTMLPDASGEAITVPAGDSITRTRNFTISTSWLAENCELVVFVQDNSTRWIHQGAMTAVIPRPALRFARYQPVLPAPGGSFDLTVSVRNIGSALAAGASATLWTNDPYVTITSANTTFDSVLVGEDVFANSPFTIQVDSTCPDPHLAEMQLIITIADSAVDTVTFPLNITASPGFADDMESGENGWSHGGIRDYWHRSTYRSVSPTNSWYCGNEAGHQYINEHDARLYTPFFTVGESTWVRFWQYYATEENYDFCLIEVNNGSPFWQELASYSGSSGNWEPVNLDLSPFQGQGVQIRFRFISDYSQVDEGWYIDDFAAGIPLSVKDQAAAAGVVNPKQRATVVRHLLVLPETYGAPRLNAAMLFDVSGRKVLDLKSGVNDLSRIAAGVYFVSDRPNGSNRLVVVR
ncbi:MAG: Omp28-related outer membrane protein [bacterium]